MALGVTVMVALMGAVEVLVAVKLVMIPVPLAARPMAVLVLVQSKLAPGVVLLNTEAGTNVLLHAVMLAGTLTVGLGFTVMV